MHPGNPSVTFSALELSSALLVPKLCIFIASKHQPYRHHQVQKCAKICLNCIQSPSITNSRMFYMDRWSEDDFSIECISLIEGTFPLSLINVESLFIEEEVISLSISALWGLCYRDVWVSRKWSGKIFSPLKWRSSQCVVWRAIRTSDQSLVTCNFFRIFQRILDDEKPNSLMGNWGLGENESPHLISHNWLARHHNSFRLHSLTVIRIYKIVFSGFLWLSASKTNQHLATHQRLLLLIPSWG